MQRNKKEMNPNFAIKLGDTSNLLTSGKSLLWKQKYKTSKIGHGKINDSELSDSKHSPNWIYSLLLGEYNLDLYYRPKTPELCTSSKDLLLIIVLYYADDTS